MREISCGAFLRSYCTKNTDEVYAFKSRGFGGKVGVVEIAMVMQVLSLLTILVVFCSVRHGGVAEDCPS